MMLFGMSIFAAHRPTIVPAKGHEEQGGMRIFVPSRMQSAKDQAAHTKLKFRCVFVSLPSTLQTQVIWHTTPLPCCWHALAT